MMKRKWIFLFSLLLLANVSSPGLRASYNYYEEENSEEADVYSQAEDEAYLNETLNQDSTTTDEIATRIKDEKTKLLELSENISVSIPLETESELEAMNVTREPAVLDPANDPGYNQAEQALEENQEERSLFADDETDSVQLGSSAILKTPYQNETEQSAPSYQKRKIRSR